MEYLYDDIVLLLVGERKGKNVINDKNTRHNNGFLYVLPRSPLYALGTLKSILRNYTCKHCTGDTQRDSTMS